MKKYFVDTNIVVDYLACRVPFSHHALAIFQAADEGRVKLYLSSHSIATCYYILRKYSEEKQLRKAMAALMDCCEVVAVEDEMLKKAFRSNLNDVEDAIQLECAYVIKNISGLVTRNIKDFRSAKIPVLGPEFISNL